jgi:aerobic-type carbon monoxide dehydrogenase small subunit (CoxS/CutS family)
MTITTRPISLTINGRATGPVQAPENLAMHDFLNEYVGLTGTRIGCGIGICHACVVIVDHPNGTSETVQTCINNVDKFAGKSIRTIEGHAQRDTSGKVVKLSPVQQALIENFAFQCGYCTPGFVNAATVLVERLKQNPVVRADVERTISEALEPHLCRCTGYVRYYQAVRDLITSTPGLTKA